VTGDGHAHQPGDGAGEVAGVGAGPALGVRAAGAAGAGAASADDARRDGHVEAFDERRGVGVVQTTAGERLPFHCVALVDGSRTVAVGATVRCAVRPGVLGRWEAAEIAVVASGTAMP
jgi:hypothetical protein